MSAQLFPEPRPAAADEPRRVSLVKLLGEIAR